MCGIFGLIDYKSPIADELIFEGLWHRGPDQQQSRSQDNIVLYHTRLAIQDLSTTGCQPMCHHGLVIVFNGEIYNHMELRKKYNLETSSHSDTLTILMLFELLGMKMLDEFDGMFAFALYDQHNRRIYLARDRAGKKPLYVYGKQGSWVFSSELNILYRCIKPEINYEALANYLYLGHFYRKSTPYIDVNELEGGHYLKIDTLTGYAENVTWYSIEPAYHQKQIFSYKESVEQLDTILQQAVRRRIDSSDLDVGSFLSGGIDSGLVTAMAAAHSSKLKTFTVKVRGSFDESLLAQQVAERYETQHTVVEIDFSDLDKDIQKILTNHGEPNSDNSVIPSYYVAREAKKHITVALNGDGADEMLGGYRRYVPFKHLNFFNPGPFQRNGARLLTSILPVAHKKQSYYTYLYRLLKFAGYADPLKMYCSASSDLFVGFEDQFLVQPLMGDLYADLERLESSGLSPLKKLLYLDFESMLFGRLLPKMDIATMAHSLEGRSPFLCREMLDFAPGLKDSYKIRGIRTKSILRDLAMNYLPETLIDQPKRGFEVPLAQWVDHELKTHIEQVLMTRDPFYTELLKKDFIPDLLYRKIQISEERRAKILFCVFSLEVWYQNLPQ